LDQAAFPEFEIRFCAMLGVFAQNPLPSNALQSKKLKDSWIEPPLSSPDRFDVQIPARKEGALRIKLSEMRQ
jgi:hypothetical protein